MRYTNKVEYTVSVPETDGSNRMIGRIDSRRIDSAKPLTMRHAQRILQRDIPGAIVTRIESAVYA